MMYNNQDFKTGEKYLCGAEIIIFLRIAVLKFLRVGWRAGGGVLASDRAAAPSRRAGQRGPRPNGFPVG
jgi:hypothetical protein